MDKYNRPDQFQDDEEKESEQSKEKEQEFHGLDNEERKEEVQLNFEEETPLRGTSPVNSFQPKEQESNKRKNTWLISLLLGVIIGILLTTVALPKLVETGIIPVESNTAKENNHTQTNTNRQNSSGEERKPTADQFVNVDVTTQVTEVVEKVLPTVVGITNIQHRADFWRQQTENEAGTGSGVIYKKDDEYAYIITNHHVIDHADAIEVVLNDETTVDAVLLGSDLFTDLAVLRIDGSHVDQVIERGSSELVKVGEPAIAIGNPLGHMFSGTVTQGVISGTNRTIPLDFNNDGRPDWQAEVIQTDAAINPGNSGGALINIEGQLIGINSMKINQSAVEGIGFAIPIDVAWPIVEELETTGEVKRPFLGVEIYSLDRAPRIEWSRTLKLPEDIEGGVYIWSVEPFSPADRAGLTRLDVITELDGQTILDILDLRKILYQEKKIGDRLDIVFYRDGERHEVTVELGSQ